jgi:hypothetical protein
MRQAQLTYYEDGMTNAPTFDDGDDIGYCEGCGSTAATSQYNGMSLCTEYLGVWSGRANV